MAFDAINVRVMEYLKRKRQSQTVSTINIFHQKLANELGTIRVVISRILKQFERIAKAACYLVKLPDL